MDEIRSLSFAFRSSLHFCLRFHPGRAFFPLSRTRFLCFLERKAATMTTTSILTLTYIYIRNKSIMRFSLSWCY